MSTDISNNSLEPDEPHHLSEGPGSARMKARWIVAVAAYLVLVSAFVLYGLVKLWPYPTPSGERPEADQVAGTSAAGQSNGSTSRTTNSQPTDGKNGSTTSTQPASGNSPAPAKNPGSSTSPAAVSSQAPSANTGGSTVPPSGSGNSQAGSGNTSPSTTGDSGSQQSESKTGKGGRDNQKQPLPDPEHIKFFGGRFEADVYLEMRLLLLVMLAGALGSLLHSLRSLYWYTGNRMMVWSWVSFYLLLPVTGALLATIFYFVVRGGFFSSQASFETTSPFGFAALAALVGLFSPQATLKLKEIAETVFSKPEPGTDHKPQGSESQTPSKPAALTIASVTPTSGAANDSVVIDGTGFSVGVVVKFGGVAGAVSLSTDKSITVVVPSNPNAVGPVNVDVTNSDAQTVTLVQGFTYVAGGAADSETIDELDGHDEIKSNTTDEDLPITEGGVG